VLNEDALVRALAAAGLSAPVRWDDVTASTNATALTMAVEGTPGWTLVAAGHQTAGRGRHGREWRDRPGSALLFSIVLRPVWEPAAVGLVSLAAGAAMAEAASEASGSEVRCKWPNDLLAGASKVGGILGESQVSTDRIAHVVVGVGVNLEAPEGIPAAAGIGPVPEEALLSAFLLRFRSLVEGPRGAIVDRWRAASATLGQHVEATTIDGGTDRGVAVDVDGTGALLLRTDAGQVRVAFGDIEHLDDGRG
jgi:BirA family transcriptional regulator, biotin operon repressor / biotin---[acetyl-CoA-carboxylase] ligase